MKPAALLFDMDGTLTTPMLNFPKIKAEMGIGNQPILESLARMEEAERERAKQVLLRHEEQAAMESTLNPGCQEVLAWVHDKRIPMALITRNSRKSVDVVLARHGLQIEVLITRDNGLFKPDPTPLRAACEKLGIEDLSNAWMIGDGRYDIEAGLAAGARTVWVSHGKTRDFPAEPWKTVVDLPALLNELKLAVSNEW